VVGLPDAVTTSSRDHQVRWQRGESPSAGGLSETGNAVDTMRPIMKPQVLEYAWQSRLLGLITRGL